MVCMFDGAYVGPFDCPQTPQHTLSQLCDWSSCTTTNSGEQGATTAKTFIG